MRMGRVIWLVLPLASSGVLANGINPPRPAAGVVLQAQCKGKAGEPGLELYRAHIRVGEATQSTIEVRGADGVEEVSLRDLTSLSGLDGRSDKAGFVQAIAARRDGVGPAKVRVRVRKDGQNVQLTGFSREGQRVSMPLAKCNEVVVGSAVAGEPGAPRGPRAD